MIAWRPSWAPSGGELAFLDLASHGAVDVVDMLGRIRVVARRSDGLSAPRWSPDGSTLVYADPAHHIATVGERGSPHTTVTHAFGDDADPVWQP